MGCRSVRHEVRSEALILVYSRLAVTIESHVAGHPDCRYKGANSERKHVGLDGLTPNKPLAGLRVLVPRGGEWGAQVSEALRERGALPVVSPLVDLASGDTAALRAALERLKRGEFEWITATSPAVVDVLAYENAVIPPSTRVAVVGEATAVAFEAAGYTVDRTPTGSENTTEALLEEWPEINTGETLNVLTLRQNTAVPVLTEGLIARGHNVTPVVAFRVVGVPAPLRVREDVASGRINAIVISSQVVAEQVRSQFPDIPQETIIACVGPQTRAQAEALGLHIQAVAGEHSIDALITSIFDTIEESSEQD